MRGAWCRTGFVSGLTGGTRTPSPGRGWASYCTSPLPATQICTGFGFQVSWDGDWGVGGWHLKMKGAEGRGELRHRSVQAAGSIPPDSGMLRAAAGGHGTMGLEGTCS